MQWNIILKGECMNCINCGAPVSEERKTCPYCGKTVQMVPDYNVFEDDDINVLMEEASAKKTSSASKEIDRESAREKERIRARKEKEKQKSLERRKKIQLVIVLISVIAICALLFVAFFKVNDFIKEQNEQSYDYQIKQAETAVEAGDISAAEAYYQKALSLLPKEDVKEQLKVHFTLADLYKEKGMTDKMIATYKDILTIDDQNYTAYKTLFQHYNSLNDIDAILELRSGVKDDRVMSLFQDFAVENPKIYKAGGTYKGAIDVMISSKLDYQIYYTLDGSDPTENGTLYTGTIKIDSIGIVTLKAVAKNERGIFSNIVTESYYLEATAPEDPIVSPDGGFFDEETYVYISVPTGCTAYYTWDRTLPTIDSETKIEYTEPFLIPVGENVLTVIIYDNRSGLSSGTYREKFTYQIPVEETPIGSEDTIENPQ